MMIFGRVAQQNVSECAEKEKQNKRREEKRRKKRRKTIVVQSLLLSRYILFYHLSRFSVLFRFVSFRIAPFALFVSCYFTILAQQWIISSSLHPICLHVVCTHFSRARQTITQSHFYSTTILLLSSNDNHWLLHITTTTLHFHSYPPNNYNYNYNNEDDIRNTNNNNHSILTPRCLSQTNILSRSLCTILAAATNQNRKRKSKQLMPALL